MQASTSFFATSRPTTRVSCGILRSLPCSCGLSRPCNCSGLRKTPNLSLAPPQVSPLGITGSDPATGGCSGGRPSADAAIFPGHKGDNAEAWGRGKGERSSTMRAPPRTVAARQLRRNLSAPKAMLWGRLRARAPRSPSFRRQHPIGLYVLDFDCGKTASEFEVAAYAAKRGFIPALKSDPSVNFRAGVAENSPYLPERNIRTLSRIKAGRFNRPEDFDLLLPARRDERRAGGGSGKASEILAPPPSRERALRGGCSRLMKASD